MGKNKQAQRTKNNARPSNSSRSAELLGSAMPNFVGFSAVKDGGYVPVLPGLSLCNLKEVEMNNVDSNFQIVLKKMNKKDATTKYKALQEFATMCQESELSAVEGMLPFWPRLYCVLAIDVEHRVREAAQLAHAAVVKRVGKSIALYLKQLAGAWFTSQYDTYPPAASAATNAFNDTFPERKIVDAIVHCQREILSYICDNVTVQTPQTLSIQKSLTSEEMEAKYQKVLVASLQGYNFYFKKVPIQEIEKTAEIHHKIISNSKFWKLAKHDALSVRTAFFNVLTSMIENADKLLQGEKKRAVTGIVNSLDETEPGVLSAVWESMLVAINKIEDWYLVVNIEKLVLAKLWRVLRSGGQCCASIVYPNLLPFISQFPKLNVDINNLYMTFFENMRQGFSVKSVQLSRSETFAVTVSFVECLRYSVLLNSNNLDLCSKLLTEQLMPVIEMCMTENLSMKQTLFCEVTHLIRYWSKNRDNEEYKSYSTLIREFWNQLQILFNKVTSLTENTISAGALSTNNSQIEFLLTLKTAPVHRRKNFKVKFSDPHEPVKTQCLNKHIELETDSTFLNELANFVNTLCITYFTKINNDRSEEYIEYLNKLITHFENRDIFVIIIKSFKADADFLEFYNKTLKIWLLEKWKETEHIVRLVFNLIKYMNDSEKDEVLKSLTEFDDIKITRSIIQCALSKSNRNDAVIMKWCSQCKVTTLLIDVAKEIHSSSYSELDKNQNLILLAFETSENGDLLISEEGINKIVSILCDSLNQTDEVYTIQLAKLISKLIPLTWAHKHPTLGAVRILETMFELCTREYCNDNDLISINEMREVWKDGLLKSYEKLSNSAFVELTKKFAAIIWHKICNSNEVHNKEILVNIATDFLEVIINNEDSDTDSVRNIVLTFLTESEVKAWMAEITGIVLYSEVITGNLHVLNLEQKIRICQDIITINLTSDTQEDNTENCLTWALFNTNLLNNLYLRLNESETDNLLLPGFIDVLINIIYSATLGHIYGDHYKSTKHYNEVNKLFLSLKDNFKTLQNHFVKDIYDELLLHFQKNYSMYGYILPYIVRLYCTELCLNENPVEYFEKCRSNNASLEDDESNREAYLQGVQILSQYIKLENIPLLMDNDICALIIARSMFTGQEDRSMYIDVLEKIVSYQKENPALLLLDCDISHVSWEQMILPLETIRLLTELVRKSPAKLTRDQWDFVIISLTLWQFSVVKSKHNYNDFKVTALTTAVSQLYYSLQNLMYKHEKEPIEDFPPELLDEWKNIFASDIETGIAETWMLYANAYNQKTTILKPVIVLDYLGKAVTMLSSEVLFKQSEESRTVNMNKMIKLSLKLLQSPLPTIQLGAYYVLKLVIPELVERDKTLIETENYDLNNLNIKKLEEVLFNTQNIVNTLLMDLKLCDTVSCTIQPFTDSYTYTLGYLLTWAIILDMCANAHGDLRYQYAELLKNNFFPCLLNNIFKLMPVEVLQDNKNKTAKLVEMFFTSPSLNFGESWTEWELDHIVCWLYTNSLRHLPVLVRQWWSTADSRVSAAVDKITTHYVSPMLCQEELLNNRLVNVENMQVKVHPTAREVVALYQMDDTKLELSIVLPANHPLGPVTVEPGQHVGGTANWRNCHMQLSIFLTHQNGSIWDGLILWKRNLDKKFAGVEECYICFSIFHISTYQIPKLSCHTCRKKFHTPCLYKWFNTSQKSTCPICRNVF